MQARSFYINQDLADHQLVKAALSFEPFIRHIAEKLEADHTSIKSKFYEFVLDHFKIDRELNSDAQEAGRRMNNEYALELIYSALTPVLQSENECYWALSTPVPNLVLYSTDAFFQLVTKSDIRGASSAIITDQNIFKLQQREYIYRLILKRLYDFNSVLSNNMYYSYVDPSTGLSRYYNVQIDTTFIRIDVKGHLPELDFETLENYLHEDDGLDILSEVLPLDLFSFEGFSVISLHDVTPTRAIEQIREAIIDPVDDQKLLYKTVIRSLKTLAENNDVHFGLLPFLKLNAEPVFDLTSCSQSIVIQASKKYGIAEEAYYAMVNHYEREPNAVFFSSITEARQKKFFFLKALKEEGIRSYAVIPVFYNKHVAGIMEVYSEKELVFYENLLSRLEFAIPMIAQLLQNSIEHFNSCIDDVIKEKFTSLQPAVQWKFNETAWEHIKNGGKAQANGNITFKDVYPLYGAIDIRNSTIERNMALQQDLKRILKNLLKVLLTLDEQHPNEQWSALIDKTNDWLHTVNDFVNTNDEMLLDQFLENEAGPALSAYRNTNAEAAGVIEPYLKMIGQENSGPAFKQRNRLEISMQMVNTAVNNYFERAQRTIQQVYPCYFEKIRTDGVEYDLYIGQAIAPRRPFSTDILRQMRLWQLTSMIDVTRLTHDLQEEMPALLRTTQMIFIHSMPIDISFRNDERRFDVEGAYNIRYEVIKKRIDKVCLKDSEERLTQPGKIAIVYFSEAEAEEQLGYIKKLQKDGLLLPEVEHLDLEELQGVAGLKALRVTVALNE
ncbi:hypothetical protein LLH06_16270 [Mucilaginibacter daejeonensis]|uniref:hypothetical protein n=1 Tax=Mucilaginibacter daejeonensis TaxID=398049 RepID=UPI001D17A497|nr:hypothetical protein [Mucilaginibacter daejeonensis]UEG52514.1 hypothetical protein LLH06_16270 [Mucilaginibacter daejeonensis]